MVQIISGPKGSGKTKKIIDMANGNLHVSRGQVVFINDREKYRVKLDKHIRYVNIDNFYINSTDMLFGFLNGLIAENYDIDIVYIDNLLRIARVDFINELDEFIKGLKLLEDKYKVRFVLSVCSNLGEIPEVFKEYVC
ncbi:MAG: hypothetical protein ACOWWR_03665 [Eubacteriales bacterium]